MNADRFSARRAEHSIAAGRVRRVPVETRRKYNRRYMRGWRADPAHAARERANRKRAYYQRKLRNVLQSPALMAGNRGDPRCGFCRERPPVTRVWRLEIRDLAPGGYVEVRVPYCGEC